MNSSNYSVKGHSSSETASRPNVSPIFTADQSLQTHQSITIGLPPEEIFSFLKNLNQTRDKIKWDIEAVGDESGSTISWKSIPGTKMDISGAILLSAASAGRGTIVQLIFGPTLSVGKIAEAQALISLKRLKAFLETGEIPTTEGQPNGREEGAQDIEPQPIVH